jgi:serine/threonine protein kinase
LLPQRIYFSNLFFSVDFGLCVEVGSVELTNMVGSPFWIPPEMIRREEHGPPADIWSLAILCLEMAHGRPPHRHSALTAMFYVGAGIAPGLEEPDKWSAEFKAFLSKMLVIDPKDRSSAEELLKDPWLACADSKKGMREILHHIFIEKSLETSLGIVM